MAGRKLRKTYSKLSPDFALHMAHTELYRAVIVASVETHEEKQASTTTHLEPLDKSGLNCKIRIGFSLFC